MSELHTLHTLFCEYSLALKGNTPRTIQWLKEIFGYYIRYTKFTTPKEITQISIERWILDGKLNKQWAAKTIRNRLTAFSLFCDWLVEREYLPENPTLRIPRPRIPKSIPRNLDKTQAEQLLDWTKYLTYYHPLERSRAAAIIGTFLYTGVRKKELLQLEVNDINFEKQTLLVRSGKGEKDRLIPLNSRLIALLKLYLHERKTYAFVTDALFVSLSHMHHQGMSESALKRLFDKLKKRSGISFSAHPLRHTFATLMLEGGCDLFSLSKMMGHSDIKTTTIYLSASTAQLQRQITKHPLS